MAGKPETVPSCETVSSWSGNRYDFSRYVFVLNCDSDHPIEVIECILGGVPFRLRLNSEGLKWDDIIIKYPNRKIAIREAHYLYRRSKQIREFEVDMVSHMLATFAQLEIESSDTSKVCSFVEITNFPERITLTRWRMLLSKFGNVLFVNLNRFAKGELYVCVKYETLAEAMGVAIALNYHTVDGQKLTIKLHHGRKEAYLFSAFREKHNQCVCVLCNCCIHPPPEETSELPKDETTNRGVPFSCPFCNYPEPHTSDFDEFVGEFDDTNVPWKDEFPEFKEDMVVGEEYIVDDDDDEVPHPDDDDDDEVPHPDDDGWEVVRFSDLIGHETLY